MKKLYQLIQANAKNDARKPFKVEASADVATIYVYDVIDADYGVNATDFAAALSQVAPNATINLRINSPGGDVFEARAIATAIKAHAGTVVAYVDGLAASAATTIAAVCDEVEIADGSFYMVHNAWTLAYGNKNDFRTTADLLDKVDGAIRADYAKRTGLDEGELAALMDAETWMTAQEAVDKGFADRMAPEPKAKNASTWDVSAYDKAPAILAKSAPAPAPEPMPEPVECGTAQTNRNRLALAEII